MDRVILGTLLLLRLLTLKSTLASSIETLRSRALSSSCELLVKESLRYGLSNPDCDVLQRARELDASSSSPPSPSLFGVPIYFQGKRLEGVLNAQGALLWQRLELPNLSQSTHHRNPRDPAFSIHTLDRYASLEDAERSAEGVTSLVAGKVAACVFESYEDSGIPQSVAWSGVLAMRERNTLICATSLEDILRLRSCLSSDRSADSFIYEAENTNTDAVAAATALKCLRLGYSLETLEEGEESPPVVESYVVNALRVAVDIFENLGVQCTKVSKRKKSTAQEDISEFDVIMRPSFATAATPFGSSTKLSSGIRPSRGLPEAQVEVCLPCGVVAGEDDGYDSSLNELLDSEGLPVAMTLTGKSEAVLNLVSGYLKCTRWSSEMLAVGSSRASAKEDMDDAREAFGIFFQTTLLRYLGKKQAQVVSSNSVMGEK